MLYYNLYIYIYIYTTSEKKTVSLKMIATDNVNYKLYTKKVKYQFKLQYKYTVIIVCKSKTILCKLVR